MGSLRTPRKVKLICGMISADADLMRRARQRLSRVFGGVDLESPAWPFDATDYYEAEMGPDLQRMFVSFAALVDPGRLAEIKLETNALESALCDEASVPAATRVVDLDPGYVAMSKLVLATTKDYSHRVYLGHGIYAEATLQWQEHGWKAWPWTYPDYAGGRYFEFLTSVRTRLREQVSELPPAAAPGGLEP